MGFTASLPFRLGPDGSVALETDPNVQTDQRIRALVGTVPTQRLMRLDYGVNLPALVFEDEDIAEGELLQMVTNSMAMWEPGVQVQSVDAVRSSTSADIPSEGWGPDDPIVDVSVRYQRVDSYTSPVSVAKKLHTAVIRVGGEVMEVLGG
jgi:phage baseplate assembly protein W